MPNVISQDVQQHILLFLPINVIYSKVTLVDKEWHNTTQELITWRMIAQREWTSMNECVTRAVAASSNQQQQQQDEENAVGKYNENLNESGKRGRDENSKSNTQKKERKNVTQAEVNIKNLNSVKFWKDLVISRFSRDNLYLYDLIAASRDMLHNVVQKRKQNQKNKFATIDTISNRMKLLDKIYKCDAHIQENKYLMFMWDSIRYETIIKDKDDRDYRSINHSHCVKANFIDHLFNVHHVKMNFNALVYTGSYEREDDDPCTVVLTTEEYESNMEQLSNDADDRNDEEEEFEDEEEIEFTVASYGDEEVYAENETMLEALYDRIGIQQDDPDKPTPAQFQSFLIQFCFMNDSLLSDHSFFRFK
jgi:hypothetical protein